MYVLCGDEPGTFCHTYWRSEAHRADLEQFLLESFAATALPTSKAGDMWVNRLLMHHPGQCGTRVTNARANSFRVTCVQGRQTVPAAERTADASLLGTGISH